MPLLNSNDIFLSSQTSIPLAICYKQPATLGNDRLALCVGANTLFPNQHQLIIDMGTCLTYDLVNNQNEYMGGAISPGLQNEISSAQSVYLTTSLVRNGVVISSILLVSPPMNAFTPG